MQSNHDDQNHSAKNKALHAQQGGFAKPARKRTFIKANPAVGAISGLIYGLSTTLSVGEGTADNEHFELLFNRCLANCNFDLVLCDKGYYDDENFQLAQRFEKFLIVMPKKNTKPESSDTDQLRFLAWLIKKCPSVVRRFYRLRPKIEAVFSQKKRKNGHVKLRRRRWELARFELLRYPFDPKEKVPKPVKRLRLSINRIIAQERVGVAQRNEMLAKAITNNLRRLITLGREYDDRITNFSDDKAFRPKRRVSPPPVLPPMNGSRPNLEGGDDEALQ